MHNIDIEETADANDEEEAAEGPPYQSSDEIGRAQSTRHICVLILPLALLIELAGIGVGLHFASDKTETEFPSASVTAEDVSSGTVSRQMLLLATSRLFAGRNILSTIQMWNVP